MMKYEEISVRNRSLGRKRDYIRNRRISGDWLSDALRSSCATVNEDGLDDLSPFEDQLFPSQRLGLRGLQASIGEDCWRLLPTRASAAL